MGDWDHNNLIHVLLQGIELARQLQFSLHVPSSSQENHKLLIQKIIEAFEKALKLVHLKVGLVGEPSQMHTRDLREQELSASIKRKTTAGWTKKIRVNRGMELEGSLDDGHRWRKYGQKDILGAKYPRGYYRCTRRKVKGCMATKQVQRSDEDSTVTEINYRGKHTCTMASHVVPSSGPQEIQEPNLNTGPSQQSDLQSIEQELNDLVLNLHGDPTGNLYHAPDQSFASFHFPLTSEIKTEEQVFTSLITENNFAENFNYPSYVSHATSGTSLLSSSGGNSSKGHLKVEKSGCVINGMIFTRNSPTVGLELPFDHFQLDCQKFTFDNPRFY